MTLLAVEKASPLRREDYLSEGAFARDLAMLRRSWICVAHVGELESPGAYLVANVAKRRLIVVRGADLELRAFYDGCLHRRAALTPDRAGRLDRLELVCPYHGLSYGLDGRAERAGCERLGLPAGARLSRIALHEAWGFVFVRLEGESEGFELDVGPAPEWFDRAELGELRLGRRTVHEVRANWKLCAENFQESHHFVWAHPALERQTPWTTSDSRSFGGRFLGGTMQLRGGLETVSETGLRSGRPFVAHPTDRRTIGDALLFPTWMTSLQPDYFLSYRLVPQSTAVTEIVAEVYFHRAAFTPAFDPSEVYRFWDLTNAEDRRVCELQQLGLEGSPFELGPYAPSEDGVAAFDLLLRRALEEPS